MTDREPIDAEFRVVGQKPVPPPKPPWPYRVAGLAVTIASLIVGRLIYIGLKALLGW